MSDEIQHKAESYIAGVLDGSVITSKWVRLACESHRHDLADGHLRDLKFRPEFGLHVIQFIETYIVGTAGKYDGKPFVLEPWIAAFLFILYGWTWTSTGLRRFKFAYSEISRGNLKSTIASALCVYELLRTKGANVYAAATDRKTAKVVFDTADLMVQKSTPLKKRIRSHRNNLHIPGTAAKFEPCSAEAKTIFSNSRPSFVVLDELHLHPTAEVWDAFSTALGKWPDPMLFAITNSGYDRQSVAWRQREYSIKVLEGVLKDDTWFSWICGLDDGDDWEDERNWIKANPSLGHAVSIKNLRAQANRAKSDPVELLTFLRLNLSVWTEAQSIFIPADKWAACDFPVDAEKLRGRQCFAGIDLSSTTDITAVVLLFPPFGDDPKWSVLPFFFLPQDSITKRAKLDRVPYDAWAHDGLICLTPGDYIDHNFVYGKIRELAATYVIKEAVYDDWRMTEMYTRLSGDGLTMVPFRQGNVSMNAPMTRLIELVNRRELAHGGNPVLAWMISNTVADVGSTGLMKPDKGKSRERIDGVSALCSALGRGMVVPIANKKRFAPFVM